VQSVLTCFLDMYNGAAGSAAAGSVSATVSSVAGAHAVMAPSSGRQTKILRFTLLPPYDNFEFIGFLLLFSKFYDTSDGFAMRSTPLILIGLLVGNTALAQEDPATLAGRATP
jgi:hypothetical protein